MSHSRIVLHNRIIRHVDLKSTSLERFVAVAIR